MDLSSISSLSSGVGWLCQVLGIYIAFVYAGFGASGWAWGVDRSCAHGERSGADGESWIGGELEEGNSVVAPAASLPPSAERKASATRLFYWHG